MTKARTDPKGSAEAAAISIGVVGAGIVGSQLITSSAAVRLGLTVRNSPVLYTLSQTGTSTAVRTSAASALRIKSTYNKAKIVAWFANPFQTTRYLMDRDFTRAGISYFGPLGAVYVYNYLQQQETVAGHDISPSKPAKPKKKKTSKKKTKAKRRTTRKSAKSSTWCKRHKRYDRCK